MQDRFPPRVLTAPFIDALKPAPAGQRYAVADAMVPGLKVRVTDRGSKSFVLWRRYPGGSKSSAAARSLGRVGVISLAEARTKARGWLELIAKGEDPAALERARREAEQDKQDDTFSAVFEEFLKRHVKGQRKAAQVEREMRKDLLPSWADKPVTAITRAHVIKIIKGIVDRGSSRQAHSVLTHSKTFFNWAIGNGFLEASPCTHIKPKQVIGEKVVRQRVLTDHEIAAFWRASGRLSYPAKPFFRMLLLTGQRKNEIGHAAWREFDFDKKVLVVPAERFKSDSTHLVPLSDAAMEILQSLPRWNRGDFLFSTTSGEKPAKDFEGAKKRLERHMLRILRAHARLLGKDPAVVTLPPFVLHDLRRTMRTRLSSLRIPDAVSEMIIGHGRKGIQRVYDQHEYQDEMREALEAWAAKLRSITEPTTTNNVVPISQGRL